MSQVQGPPPTITDVQPSNQSLLVRWESDPYSSSSDATLLVINTTSNIMSAVLLDNLQILEGEYLITGLVNGDVYALLFSILDASGNSHNSNTVTSIASDIPLSPTIVSYTLDDPSYSTVDIVATLGTNAGAPVTSVIFRIYLDASNILTQAFNPNFVDNTYQLSGFVEGDDYIISCQALNAAGYSNVSNSISFRNADVAGTPVLDTIESGSNHYALLSVSGTNTSSSSITYFKVYNYDAFYANSLVVSPILPDASYNIDISYNDLVNKDSYSFSVSAVTSGDESMKSNVSTVVPAEQLAFTITAITFPASNQIKVDFSNNDASWANPSREVILGFSGPGVSATRYISNYNVFTYTYTLDSGSTLTAGDEYTVTINGYCIVPQYLYPGAWVIPTLTDNQYAAEEVTGSKTYAIAPDPVTDLAVITDIIDTSGIIQASWIPGADNGSPITNYTCYLYTVSDGQRSPPIRTITTTATNCLFTNLFVFNTFYSVGIIANNSVGPSTETNYLPNTEIGFRIIGSVDGVTNLRGYQTSYDGSVFLGNLTWDYSGPGTGYTNAHFDIYSVVNSVKTFLGAVNYTTGQLSYAYPVNLGTTPNVPKEFAVNVVASSPLGLSESIYSYIVVTPGVAPVISDVVLSPVSGSLTNWKLAFTVTNLSDLDCIQDSCYSLVMPSPISEIANGVNPIQTGYDLAEVDNSPTKSYRFVRELGYQAISNDYLFITCSNGYEGTFYSNKWGSP